MKFELWWWDGEFMGFHQVDVDLDVMRGSDVEVLGVETCLWALSSLGY